MLTRCLIMTKNTNNRKANQNDRFLIDSFFFYPFYTSSYTYKTNMQFIGLQSIYLIIFCAVTHSGKEFEVCLHLNTWIHCLLIECSLYKHCNCYKILSALAYFATMLYNNSLSRIIFLKQWTVNYTSNTYLFCLQ